MYNINGLLVVFGIVSISFSVLPAQTINTSENYKKNYKKAREWQYKNADSTRFFANKALLAAQNGNEKAGIYYFLGEMAQSQEWSNSAVHYYQKALKLYSTEKEKHKVRIALITPYRRQKKMNTALNLARWVNRYLLEKNDTVNLASNYSQLGNIFFNLSQADTFSVKWTDSSLFYHRKSIALRKDKSPETLPKAYYNQSFAYEAISPDSAIHYTKLALNSAKISDYDKALYNLRLAQINYRKKDFEQGSLYLDVARDWCANDLNLQFMHTFYEGCIALNLRKIGKAETLISRCDATLKKMEQSVTNIVDKKSMSQSAAEAYGEIARNAFAVFKQTKDSTYLKLANKYQNKKQQASKQYRQSNQQIVVKDSLVLANTANQVGDLPMTDTSESLQTGIVVLVLAFLLSGWGVWWWLRYSQQQGMEETPTKSEVLVDVQGLNTQVLSTLAGQQDYEQIFNLLDKHIGVEGLTEKEGDLLPGETFTFQEKVYLVLKMEGFSDWEICQMLDQTKRTIGEWNKKIQQKIKLPEKPE